MNIPPLPRFQTSTGVRVLILLAMALVGVLVVGGVTFLLTLIAGSIDVESGPGMYAALLAQDVLVFIVPAIVAMALCYHQPMRVMGFDRAPSWSSLLVVLAVCALSLPMMNWVVEWNKGLHLPDSLSHIEDLLRLMEDMAEVATEELLGGTSVGVLLLNVLVVGVMAGVSEETFFRGGLMRMLTAGRCNVHVAVWVVAMVFSAIHFQFFGFVPRMLLGAWLGYLLVRTGSLWVPIIAHALNNSLVVVVSWLENRELVSTNSLDSLGVPKHGEFPWLALASAIATIAIIVLWMRRKKQILAALPENTIPTP